MVVGPRSSVVDLALQQEAGPPWVGASRGVGMDAGTFDEFYESSFRRLVGQIYAMCGNLAESQDCVQEAFVRAWDKRRSLDTDRSPEAWVRTVAYRLAVSRWRRARKALRAPDRAYAQQASGEPDVSRVALSRALQQLPPDQRRAIVLHHLCDLSLADIAVETGVPVGTVKARLSRGRAALAALLKDEPEEQVHG
jgi:RNA polymerase sigma-70 factor, ECF subfamily